MNFEEIKEKAKKIQQFTTDAEELERFKKALQDRDGESLWYDITLREKKSSYPREIVKIPSKYLPQLEEFIDNLYKISMNKLQALIAEEEDAVADPTYKIPTEATWIYNAPSSYDGQYRFNWENIEAALGFKLFYWQKGYIQNGQMRGYGYTTAQVLKDLLNYGPENCPILTKYIPASEKYRVQMYKDLRQKLVDAGISCREVK